MVSFSPDSEPLLAGGADRSRSAAEHHVLFAGNEIRGAQVGDDVVLRPRTWSKSNSAKLLRAGNRAARMRPSPPPCASRPDTSRLQAGDEELLVRPGPGAGAFGQPGHRFAQGGRLQRPGAVGDLGGQVPSGLRRGGHQATPLSKLSRPSTVS